MKRILLALAIILIASLAAHAQDNQEESAKGSPPAVIGEGASPYIGSALVSQGNTFVMTSSASGVTYTNPGGASFGFNANISLYPVAPYTFPSASTGAVSSGSCDPTDTSDLIDCSGRGILVAAFDNAGAFESWLPLSYVSPGQINVTLPQSTSLVLGVTLQFAVYFQQTPTTTFNLSAVWSLDRDLISSDNVQPYLTYATLGGVFGAYLTGTLYGYTVDGAGNITGAIALKSLTDGTVNPSTYNGKPTIAQIYVSGCPRAGGSPTSGPYAQFKWELDGATGIATYRPLEPFNVGVGLFVTNVIPGPKQNDTWGGAGRHQVKLGYGNTLIFTQESATTGLIWMN